MWFWAWFVWVVWSSVWREMSGSFFVSNAPLFLMLLLWKTASIDYAMRKPLLSS
jgi:hypothetical protein